MFTKRSCCRKAADQHRSFCSRSRLKVEGLNSEAGVSSPPQGEDKHLLSSPAEVQEKLDSTSASDCTNQVIFDHNSNKNYKFTDE